MMRINRLLAKAVARKRALAQSEASMTPDELAETWKLWAARASIETVTVGAIPARVTWEDK